jgi:hypothetical protein
MCARRALRCYIATYALLSVYMTLHVDANFVLGVSTVVRSLHLAVRLATDFTHKKSWTRKPADVPI